MDYINYVKQYPMMGQIGLGGGATSLGRYASNPGEWSGGDRGLFGGGKVSGNAGTDTIDYRNVTTTGSFSNFGTLSAARKAPGAGCNGTRAVWGGGATGYVSDVIDYVTTTSTGNATDFGNLQTEKWQIGCVSNNSRAVCS